MYHDAYTIQLVEDRHLSTFNFVSGMVPFLLNLILDVSCDEIYIMVKLYIVVLVVGSWPPVSSKIQLRHIKMLCIKVIKVRKLARKWGLWMKSGILNPTLSSELVIILIKIFDLNIFDPKISAIIIFFLSLFCFFLSLLPQMFRSNVYIWHLFQRKEGKILNAKKAHKITVVCIFSLLQRTLQLYKLE